MKDGSLPIIVRRGAVARFNQMLFQSSVVPVILCIVCSLAHSQETTNTLSPFRVHHAFSGAPLRLVPTAAYDQAIAQLMLKGANRAAHTLCLEEHLPLSEADVSVFLDPPALFIHSLQLGNLETRNYVYEFGAGTTLSGIDYKHFAARWRHIKEKYTWPISRFDTNAALKIAMQIMDVAGADVAALNRDCVVDIRASMPEGRHGRHFIPFYWVHWYIAGTNVLFDDLPDQAAAADKREVWPLQTPSGKMMAAILQFLEPTKAIQSLQVYDPKYLKKKSAERLDLMKLLTLGNSRKAVTYEIELATNPVVQRENFIKQGVPESWLKDWGLEETNALEKP